MRNRRPEVVVTYIRHGNTAKAATDRERQLTEKGYEQARARGQKLGQGFDLVLASAVDRAIRTAEGIVDNQPDLKIIPVEELYTPPGPIGEAITALSNRLGYKPLREYLEEDGTGALYEYAKRAGTAVTKHILEHDAKNILVIGHAVLMSAAGLSVRGICMCRACRQTSGGSINLLDTLLDVQFGECEGFRFSPFKGLELIQD